jgi:pimeloyl-ACP methyl ester carboxylesterase
VGKIIPGKNNTLTQYGICPNFYTVRKAVLSKPFSQLQKKKGSIMRRKCKCLSFVITMVFMIILSFLIGCSGGGGGGNAGTGVDTTPIIFVHGYAGTVDQFETQAMRFASNGFPASRISGYEWNTTLDAADSLVQSGLDAYIDSVRLQTGADKVNLLGHSKGTTVSHAYLADPAHAAKVAHYVNIDGRTSTTPPGGVPTLALWAELTGTSTVREIGGATNITLADTTHVQAATCVDSFVAIYKFFNNGQAPATTDILLGSSDNIELAGRILTFMTNAVPADLNLEIYKVDKATGVRISSIPDYSTSINADGNFKFTNATAGSNYEFYLTSTSDDTFAHYYYEPFIRSDYLVRLKYLAPAVIALLMDQSAAHSNLIVIRDKEFLGVDSMSPNEDHLIVNGTELCAGLLPGAGLTGTRIALFIFDKGSDTVNNLGPITTGIISTLPFITGTDFYMAAANPPVSPISIVLEGRNTGGRTQKVNVPNWQSTPNIITVQMWDY